jgi:hypothetical protein
VNYNKDKNGIICQPQPDGSLEGGDSVCWTGHYIYLTGEKFPFVGTFEKGFGGYVRHPDPQSTNSTFGAYYKNPWNGCISRDQLTGIIAAFIRQKESLALIRVTLNHLCRLGLFSYNTIPNGVNPASAKWKLPDVTLLDVWALFLRGFGKTSWLAWPALCILDIQMLLGTLIVNRQKDPDQINYAIKYLISREFVPTPTSWLTSKILDKEHLNLLIKQYWEGWRNNPEMTHLYKQQIEKY